MNVYMAIALFDAMAGGFELGMAVINWSDKYYAQAAPMICCGLLLMVLSVAVALSKGVV